MNNDRAHIDAVAQTSPAAAALSTAPFALMKSQFAPAPPLRGSVEAAAVQSQSSGGSSVALEGSAAMEVGLTIGYMQHHRRRADPCTESATIAICCSAEACAAAPAAAAEGREGRTLSEAKGDWCI